MKKESLLADAWLKEVAPSTELRQWFGHRVERWEDFRRKYREELAKNAGAWQPIVEASRRGTVTLLYSAHDELHNGARVLREFLVGREGSRASVTTGRRGSSRQRLVAASSSRSRAAGHTRDGGRRRAP
jgi:uncharacterized protein YeaO (DUF488 family)